MNKYQLLVVFIIGVQIGKRLPSAKIAAEQFKDSVGASIVTFAANLAAEEINKKIFSNLSSGGRDV